MPTKFTIPRKIFQSSSAQLDLRDIDQPGSQEFYVFNYHARLNVGTYLLRHGKGVSARLPVSASAPRNPIGTSLVVQQSAVGSKNSACIYSDAPSTEFNRVDSSRKSTQDCSLRQIESAWLSLVGLTSEETLSGSHCQMPGGKKQQRERDAWLLACLSGHVMEGTRGGGGAKTKEFVFLLKRGQRRGKVHFLGVGRQALSYLDIIGAVILYTLSGSKPNWTQ